ncbi:Iron-sulfur assembly protein 1, partial [Dissophora globulifera]
LSIPTHTHTYYYEHVIGSKSSQSRGTKDSTSTQGCPHSRMFLRTTGRAEVNSFRGGVYASFILWILTAQTPAAVTRLRLLTDGPEPKVVRVGIRTKGCSGQQYDLQYTSKKEKFDEEIKQDGVTVLVDNKALLSVLGSEMDYVEDKLSAQFVFNNPNVKESCGCGMSFMT